MDQFNSVNSDSYKKKNILQEFFHSCLGKIVIFLGVLLVLYIFAIITVPTKKMMLEEAFDNIQECLQDNDSIKADEIDEFINNISRTISVADTTKTNKEVLNTFLKYNTLIVYSHLGFKTASIRKASVSALVSSRPSSPPLTTTTWWLPQEPFAATITSSSTLPLKFPTVCILEKIPTFNPTTIREIQRTNSYL